ncbi:MAK10-like protein [Tanacetum coccineum]
MVQNGCSFHGLRSEDPNQHLKDFLKLVDSLDLDGDNRERTRLRLFQFSLRDQASNWLERLPAGSITTWEDLTTRFLAQFFPPGRTAKLRNDILMFQQHHGESLFEAWTRFKDLLQKVPHHGIDLWLQALLEDLALYDNESWNDPRDFAKTVKAIALPQDVPSTSDRRLIELKNQVQCLMEDHLALTQPTQVTKSLPHVRSAVVLTTLSIAWKIPNKPLLNMYPRVPMKREQQSDSHDSTEENKEEERGNPKNHPDSPTPPDPSIAFITEKVLQFNSLFELLGLVSPSPNAKLVCTKEEDGDMMFIEIIPKDDNSHKEEPRPEVEEVEYFDIFPTKSELAKLNPREDANGGVSNFTGRIKGMHVFIGNFTYILDFMIFEDISSIIDHRLLHVVLGRPFVEISNMTHDPPEGVVRFTKGTNEVAYKIPHKIEQYDSLSNLEKEHTKLVYLRNEEYKRRGVEYVMSKILGFYKECLELGPKYLRAMDDDGEVMLYLIRRNLEILRKFHWMILGGRFNQLSHISSLLLSKPGEN